MLYVMKHFNETFKQEDIINEVYADGGTLERYLRDNTTTLLKWESQLKIAREITEAILWLHDTNIIHGDLHPKNNLITIKLIDFGCSRLHRSKCFTEPRGIIPYIDPKILNDNVGNTKPDISEVISKHNLIGSDKNNESSSSEPNASKKYKRT
ncbi:kinase-like domain-containing protein [Rhizophagus clarus]|uniref:Kinase-like domain-containing protein n=1 Tax=Rhizophagus clarus TaxID=94130 RepID=A0A8H3KSE1_9GLOM|nr:kinase-like domain-containing protein [Rhizophagus clarus]